MTKLFNAITCLDYYLGVIIGSFLKLDQSMKINFQILQDARRSIHKKNNRLCLNDLFNR